MSKNFDIIVVGGGHAGCEAVHAAARLGLNSALITMELDAIARMSCNPSIGGPAKGHLTREIDALGGLQGRITDATYLSIRMLNTGKGASVQALRAQSDRNAYSREMRRVLESTPGVTLIEGEAGEVLTGPVGTGFQPVRDKMSATVGTGFQPVLEKKTGRMPVATETHGVRLTDGREYTAPRVVVCPGTFTRAECFMGERRHKAGRWGETSADALGANLEQLGLALHRLKTGTSPRIHRDSADYTRLRPQLSEWRDDAFCNYAPSMLPAWFLPNWLGQTTPETNEILRRNQLRSALYSGAISGTGPRYCPSIEDKVFRFPEAERHPVFIEPDGLDSDLLYLQGLSTSMPLDVQFEFLHSVPGLERAKIKRPGYAVEYDAVNPVELDSTLQHMRIAGLYSAGQFNGTSGYEEAAAQGLVAGANAALSLIGHDPLPLSRENSYIGVMIDDLTTRGTEEPYRMLTARAEHRLLLRHDNAALRLGPIARDCGLLSAAQISSLDELRTQVYAVQAELRETKLTHEQQAQLELPPSKSGSISAEQAVRQGASISRLNGKLGDGFFERAARQHVEVEIRYAGYLNRARAEIEKVQAHHSVPIPPDFSFAEVQALLKSTRENLERTRPATLGQAARVPGVTPADVANLLVALKRHRQPAAAMP